MYGLRVSRGAPDSPDQADDLVDYVRHGPRELPPGIPTAQPPRTPRTALTYSLGTLALMAAVLVGCNIVKPTASPSANPTLAGPSTGASAPGHSASGHPTASHPTPGHSTPGHPSPSHPGPGHPTPSGPASGPLPATTAQLAAGVTQRVFAAKTAHVRIDLQTPQAHTVRETLTGDVSVAPDGTLVGTAAATADRYNGVHVDAKVISLPNRIYIAPPADMMPSGKTWTKVTPDLPMGRTAYAARQARDVLYFGATSWDLLQYANVSQRPQRQGSGSATTVRMGGTVQLASVMPHLNDRMRQYIIMTVGEGTKQITWQVQLDDQLLPKEYRITANSPIVGPLTAVVTFSDWRAPVAANDPSPATVLAYSQLPSHLRD